jgi:hypothetical protein
MVCFGGFAKKKMPLELAAFESSFCLSLLYMSNNFSCSFCFPNPV